MNKACNCISKQAKIVEPHARISAGNCYLLAADAICKRTKLQYTQYVYTYLKMRETCPFGQLAKERTPGRALLGPATTDLAKPCGLHSRTHLVTLGPRLGTRQWAWLPLGCLDVCMCLCLVYV
jgi:hypothetical protein